MPQRRSNAAQSHTAAQPPQLRLDLGKLDDSIGEARMLTAQRAAGDRVNAIHVRCLEERFEREVSYKAARTREQRYP
jgi:hypothetical protein